MSRKKMTAAAKAARAAARAADAATAATNAKQDADLAELQRDLARAQKETAKEVESQRVIERDAEPTKIRGAKAVALRNTGRTPAQELNRTSKRQDPPTSDEDRDQPPPKKKPTRETAAAKKKRLESEMAAARKAPPTPAPSRRTAEQKEEDADTYVEREDSSSSSDSDAESDGMNVEAGETFGAKGSGGEQDDGEEEVEEEEEEEEAVEKPAKKLSKRAQTIRDQLQSGELVDQGQTDVINPAALKVKEHPRIRADYSSGPGSGSDTWGHARLDAREAATARTSGNRPPASKSTGKAKEAIAPIPRKAAPAPNEASSEEIEQFSPASAAEDEDEVEDNDSVVSAPEAVQPAVKSTKKHRRKRPRVIGAPVVADADANEVAASPPKRKRNRAKKDVAKASASQAAADAPYHPDTHLVLKGNKANYDDQPEPLGCSLSDTANVALAVTVFFDADGHMYPPIVNNRDTGLDLAARSFRVVIGGDDKFKNILLRWLADPGFRGKISYQVWTRRAVLRPKTVLLARKNAPKAFGYDHLIGATTKVKQDQLGDMIGMLRHDKRFIYNGGWVTRAGALEYKVISDALRSPYTSALFVQMFAEGFFGKTGTLSQFNFSPDLYPDAKYPHSPVKEGDVCKELPESMVIWVATAIDVALHDCWQGFLVEPELKEKLVRRMYEVHQGAVETWDPKSKSYTLQWLYQRASAWEAPKVGVAAPIQIESGDSDMVAYYLDGLP